MRVFTSLRPRHLQLSHSSSIQLQFGYKNLCNPTEFENYRHCQDKMCHYNDFSPTELYISAQMQSIVTR